MVEFIKENIELIVDTPLVAVSILSAIRGYMLIESAFWYGFALFAFSAAILIVVRILEGE